MKILKYYTDEFMLVIMDLDGTLIDSQKQHLKSFQEGIKKVLGRYEKKWDKLITKRFGIPRYEILKEIFPKVDDSKIVETARYMQELISTKLIKEIKMLPTALEFLKANYTKHVLALATSSTRRFKDIVFEKFGLDKYFKVIVVREDVKHAKPDPEILLKTIEIAKVERSEAVYIGDSLYDYLCAKNAGIRFIGVMQNSLFKKELKRVKAYCVKDFSKVKLVSK